MQMLWNIDDGKSANIKGIPEENKLKLSVKKLLKLLDLERGEDRDTFRLSPKSSPTLQVLGFVFEEPIETTRAAVNQHNEAQEKRWAEKEARREARKAKGRAASASESEEAKEAEPVSLPPPRRVVGPAMPSSSMLAAAAASMNDLPSDYGEEDEEDGSFLGPPPPELVKEIEAAPQDEREAEVIRIMKVPLSTQIDAYAILGVTSSATSLEVKRRYMRLSLLIHPDKCSHKDAHEAFQLVSKSAKLLQDAGARKALDEHLEDVELRKMAEEEALRLEKERQWNVALGKESNLPGQSKGHLPIKREQWMMELPPERREPSREQQLAARNFSRSGIKERGDASLWTNTPDEVGRERGGGPSVIGGSISGGSLLLGPSSGIGPSMPTSETARAVEAFNSQYRKKTLMEEHLERLEAEKKKGGVKGKAKEEIQAKRLREESSSDDSSGDSSSDGECERRRKSSKHHKKDKSKSKKSKKEKKSKEKSHKTKRDESWRQRLPSLPSAPKPREADWEAEGHPWQPWDRDRDLERKPVGATNPSKVLAADAASRFATSSKNFL